MQTLDLELEVASPAPRKPKSPKAKPWGGPRPVNHPEPTEAVLLHEMRMAYDSLRCCKYHSAAYHAIRAANVYAELDPGVVMAIADTFGDAPSPLGDWSSGAWIVYCVEKGRTLFGGAGYTPCDPGEWCPPDPPLSEYHARDYEYMREAFCRE